jgi:hypothetical protein
VILTNIKTVKLELIIASPTYTFSIAIAAIHVKQEIRNFPHTERKPEIHDIATNCRALRDKRLDATFAPLQNE